MYVQCILELYYMCMHLTLYARVRMLSVTNTVPMFNVLYIVHTLFCLLYNLGLLQFCALQCASILCAVTCTHILCSVFS